ncbi:MAG TPA: DNA polymerase III subunit delta [Clostridiales bacterium]|nr:DNA polymerase III subunit delta [Clostridiales bacterium]
MIDLEELSIKDETLKYINESVKSGRLFHSYIIVGEEGMAKNEFARYFAKTLQCHDKNRKRCNECISCRQFESNNNPDIIRIKSKSKSIPVEDIRTQLNNDIQIKPYSNKYKIYIIDKADSMLESAQNALLKTIEEPPPYAIIILLVENMSNLLPTIISRSLILNLKSIDENKIKKYLIKNYQIPDYLAELASKFSGGNIGKAIKFATTDYFIKIKDETINFLKNINKIQLNQIIEFLNIISKDKDRIDDYLDIIILWYRDILIYKATENIDRIMFKDETQEIINCSELKSYISIDNIINSIETTKQRLKYNVNFDITLELMLLNLKEKCND